MAINEKDELSTTQAATIQTSSLQLDIIENFSVSPAISTLGFLFQRFDMLEKQLAKLKSRDTRDFAPPTVSAAPAQTISTNNGELVARILALEEVIAD